jgi:hypothetical protein
MQNYTVKELPQAGGTDKKYCLLIIRQVNTAMIIISAIKKPLRSRYFSDSVLVLNVINYLMVESL